MALQVPPPEAKLPPVQSQGPRKQGWAGILEGSLPRVGLHLRPASFHPQGLIAPIPTCALRRGQRRVAPEIVSFRLETLLANALITLQKLPRSQKAPPRKKQCLINPCFTCPAIDHPRHPDNPVSADRNRELPFASDLALCAVSSQGLQPDCPAVSNSEATTPSSIDNALADTATCTTSPVSSAGAITVINTNWRRRGNRSRRGPLNRHIARPSRRSPDT